MICLNTEIDWFNSTQPEVTDVGVNKDVREPASSYYAGSHRTEHRLAMGSKMAVCLRLFDNGADSIPSNIASRRLH